MKPRCRRDDENYGKLHTQVAVSPGGRSELFSVGAEEFSKKDDRKTVDLLGGAELAVRPSLPGAKELAVAATEKILVLFSFLLRPLCYALKSC